MALDHVQKEKNLLDLEYQSYLNYMNVVLVIGATAIITLIFSGNGESEKNTWILFVTLIVLIFLSAVFGKLKFIRAKIRKL